MFRLIIGAVIGAALFASVVKAYSRPLQRYLVGLNQSGQTSGHIRLRVGQMLRLRTRQIGNG